MVLSRCYSKNDHRLKWERQDSEQRVDEKRVEKEVKSPKYSLTTRTSHGLAICSPPSPEYWPYSPEHSPTTTTTPPYVPDHRLWPYSTGYNHTSPYYIPEYKRTRPNHSQDYTPTGTGSNIRYDARDGGFALRTSFRAFSRCQYQEEKKFKRERQDSEQSVDEKRVENELNSPEYSPTTHTSHGPAIHALSCSEYCLPRPEYWLPTGTGSNIRYDARDGGFALRTYFRAFCRCQYQEEKKFKRERQDSELSVDEKRVENELYSPDCSPTTPTSHGPAIHAPPCSEYWLPRPEYWPPSPERNLTAPPYVRYHSTGYSRTSPYYSLEYRPTSPNHSEEDQDYTPTDTSSNVRYDTMDGGFALGTSFRAFTGCQYQEEKKFKRARQDSEQRIDEKRVEEELNSPEYSPTSPTSYGPEYWPPSPDYSPHSPEYSPTSPTSYGPEYSPTTPPYIPDVLPGPP